METTAKITLLHVPVTGTEQARLIERLTDHLISAPRDSTGHGLLPCAQHTTDGLMDLTPVQLSRLRTLMGVWREDDLSELRERTRVYLDELFAAGVDLHGDEPAAEMRLCAGTSGSAHTFAVC